MADVWLKAPGDGHIIGMTAPLHWTITDQLRDGKLHRVNPDGTPWAEPAVAGTETPAEGSCAAAPAGPPQPRRSAPKSEWAQHAAALGLTTTEAADSMSRTALIDLCVPPEQQPQEV